MTTTPSSWDLLAAAAARVFAAATRVFVARREPLESRWKQKTT